MKKLLFFHLLLIALIPRAVSQNTGDQLQKSPTCFFVAHAVPEANKKQISKTFCVGDKIKVILMDNSMIKGTLDHISGDSLLTVDGKDIHTGTIQSFKTPGLNSGTAIAGGLFVLGGLALLIDADVTNLDFESGPAKLIFGIVSVTGGLVTLASSSYAIFETKKDDQWIYKQ